MSDRWRENKVDLGFNETNQVHLAPTKNFTRHILSEGLFRSPLASASEKSTVIASILSPLLKSSYCWLTEEKISLKTFPWASPFCLFKRHRATGVPAWRERTWHESRLYFQHYSYTYMHLSLGHSLFSHRPECTVFTPPPPPHPQILHTHCLQFFFGRTVIPRRNWKQWSCKIWGEGRVTRCIMIYVKWWIYPVKGYIFRV